MMLKQCIMMKTLIVGCSLIFMCFDSTTSAFPTADFIQDNGLDINGSNVCKYPITKTRNMKILRQREHKERYNTTCVKFVGWPFIVKIKPCTKTRIRLQSFYQLTVQNLFGYSLDCCHQWEKMRKNSTECLKPICVHGCKHAGKCVAPDSCTCDPGWRGYTCGQDINECYIENGGCQQECHNTRGSYVCTCRSGYISDMNNTTQCLDIDECKSPQSRCLCAGKDPHCNATCLNTVGSFRCVCSKGYRLNGPNICTDIDECLSSITNNCPHQCVNKQGSYECACFNGFKYEKKTGMCEDLDECANNNGGCQHRCLNFYGSYRCLCRRGYLLALNRRKCRPFSGK